MPPNPMHIRSILPVGVKCWYKEYEGRGITKVVVKVLKVHYDKDDKTLHYSVRMPDGSELYTVGDELSLYGGDGGFGFDRLRFQQRIEYDRIKKEEEDEHKAKNSRSGCTHWDMNTMNAEDRSVLNEERRPKDAHILVLKQRVDKAETIIRKQDVLLSSFIPKTPIHVIEATTSKRESALQDKTDAEDELTKIGC